jgi:hypothetical protein
MCRSSIRFLMFHHHISVCSFLLPHRCHMTRFHLILPDLITIVVLSPFWISDERFVLYKCLFRFCTAKTMLQYKRFCPLSTSSNVDLDIGSTPCLAQCDALLFCVICARPRKLVDSPLDKCRKTCRDKRSTEIRLGVK